MISGLKSQLASTNAHIRSHGCIFSCYLAMVQDTVGKIFSDQQINSIFLKAKSVGAILDNDIPLTEKDWYRSFVIDADRVVEIAFGEFKKKGYGKKVYHGDKNPRKGNARYTIIELLSGKTTHFVMGDISDDLKVTVTYDPGTGRFPRTNIKSVRHWEIVCQN